MSAAIAAAGSGAEAAREIEIKLAFDPGDRPEIEAHPFFAQIDPEKETLISVYFDTPDLALRKAHMALRVRKIGSRYIQGLKGMEGAGQLFDRPEWEREIGGFEPDLGLIAGTPLAPLLDEKARASLRPLFRTRIERTFYPLTSDGTDIEVTFDAGEVETSEKWAPVHELELELKRGNPAGLFRLARRLAETAPLRLAVKTKAERGYELAAGATPGPEKAKPVALGEDMSSAAAFRAIGENCLRQIVANEDALYAGETEGLHQMRIGLRRLRAAIAVFPKMLVDTGQDRIEAELKWITNELGPARDLDVIAADVLPKPPGPGKNDEAKLAAARDVLAASRSKAYAAAIAAVRSDRFRIALFDIAEWIEAGPWTLADELQDRRDRSVRKHAAKTLERMRKSVGARGEALRDLGAKERHKLRLRAKNLRYAIEFFASLYPEGRTAKRREAALSALKDLQDELGALNDLAQREALLAGGHEFAQHMAGLLAPKEAETERLLKRAEGAHARLSKVKSFWE